MNIKQLVDRCRVEPHKKVRLEHFDPGYAGDKKVPKKERKKAAEAILSI